VPASGIKAAGMGFHPIFSQLHGILHPVCFREGANTYCPVVGWVWSLSILRLHWKRRKEGTEEDERSKQFGLPKT
jgi:hypothetical protein